MPDPIVLRTTDGGVVLPVRAQPKASRNAVCGFVGGRLKVAVTAPPDKGKANEAIVKVVAEALGVPKSRVSLLRGETSRDKELLVACSDPEAVRRRLALMA